MNSKKNFAYHLFSSYQFFGQRGSKVFIQCFTAVVLLFSFFKAEAQFYNGTQVEFGKNRVQYDDFEWQFYRFDKFETYFYTGGKDLAVHTANYANRKVKEYEKFLDFYLNERIQFIVYNKQSHFRQSNIGLTTNENYNIGGVTRIVGSKVFIYFEGDYDLFEKQIDAGVLRVLVYQMLYGGNWREVLRNSALLSLPEWYINGLISYLTVPNDPLVNARIKDGILNEDFKRFNSLSNEDATVAGHAMWQYIAETYGKNVISNILYMTRISREIDDGFLYVIGVPFEDLYEEWISFYKGEYIANADVSYNSLGDQASIKIRKNRLYQNFSIDRNGKYFAYSTNKLGQYKVYLYDIQAEKRIKVFQDEHKLDRIQDYSYPIVEWHPSGKLLTFITEDKGQVLLHTYNIEEKSTATKPIFKIEKVLSYDYLPDGRQFIFSGVEKGQSDLFLYNSLGNTQRNLTNDIYDDLEPVVTTDGNKIFFTSNRLNDSLNISHQVDRFNHEKDIFVYDLLNDENPISEVTNTSNKDESSPVLLDDIIHYTEQVGESSIRYKAEFDSAVSRIDTIIHYNYFYKSEIQGQYPRNLIAQTSNQEGEIQQITYKDGRYALYSETLTDDLLSHEEKSQVSNTSNSFPETEAESFYKFKKSSFSKEVDIYNYEFNSSSAKKNDIAKLEPTATKDEVAPLVFPTQRLYRLNFRTDNSVLQLNNTFINSQYQLFNGGPYTNSGLGLNTKIGIVDLFEDYRIYGGFRYSGDLIEYSLSYQNLKKRLDKEFIIARTRTRNTNTSRPTDIKTLKSTASLIWPFSEITSLRGVASIRNDKTIFLASDLNNIEQPTIDEYWGAIKAAYVYDNTRNVALNIRYGTRFKIFAEQYQLLYADDPNTTTSSDLSVFGFDYRHYQKIHREFIFVGRVAGSKSFGSNPIIYYLGGVDEWWKQDIFDDDTPIDVNQNYGFQSLAANMRGFLQNVRNGSSFAVINTELRLPVFSYFMNRPIQSDFVRNFQVIGFADVGTAWTGESPFVDNPLDNEVQVGNPITVTYENINDPVVGGIGFGLRTTLLGYFVRVDWGWGIENGEINKEREFMFSLSLDI